MKYLVFLMLISLCTSCSSVQSNTDVSSGNNDENDLYRMVFASCNDQDRAQPLWQPIIANTPNLFVWGGDNVYADTSNMERMKADYDKVWSNIDYQGLSKMTEITGTWDDHDYGKNDAGVEWKHKVAAKNILLDFLKVPETDERRSREGVYTSKLYSTDQGSIKLILLDTRTFRDALKKSDNPDWRYEPWGPGEGGSVLGMKQWEWLETELQDEVADFTVIVTSIQFLSDRHGWEKWANHPDEVVKMNQLIQNAKAKNILLLSGDRHMAEISVKPLQGKNYSLVDFTSSGMTHTWITNATEENPYRVSNVVKRLNFGVLLFDFKKRQVTFEIRGEDNFLYEQYMQQY